MNCSPTMAIALLLLSLTAGMHLLYKTRKESLGAFFKIVSWFIIVISICSMICCSVCCVLKCCKSNEQCAMNSGDCGGEMNKCVKGDGGAGRCDSDSYRKEGKGCCKDMMECEEEKVERKKEDIEPCAYVSGQNFKKDSIVDKK